MADSKLSALTALGAAPASLDELYIRDVSEATAADQSKRVVVKNLFLYQPALFKATTLSSGVDGATSWAALNANTLTANGTGSNVDLNLEAKGTGQVKSSSGIASTDIDMTGKTLTLDDDEISGDKVHGGQVSDFDAVVHLPSASGEAYGIKVLRPVGETVAFGQIGYFDGTDGEFKKTDADAASYMPAEVMFLQAKNDGEDCLMLRQGYARNDSWAFASGDILYADTTTAGGMTSTRPSGSGDQVQRVGKAESPKLVWFNPSPDVVEVS